MPSNPSTHSQIPDGQTQYEYILGPIRFKKQRMDLQNHPYKSYADCTIKKLVYTFGLFQKSESFSYVHVNCLPDRTE